MFELQLIFVAGASDIVRGEIFVMLRNFECGDILDLEIFYVWRNFTCGDFLNFHMWRKGLSVEK